MSNSLFLQPGACPVPDYELVERLGEGGFGEVWKAKGPGGFSLAMKFILLEKNKGKEELRALELMKDIRHPHLVGMHGAWQIDRFLIIAMELGERTLLDRLREATSQQAQAGIPRKELVTYLLDSAKGLDFLNEPRHAIGDKQGIAIQHRDVKPANLLLIGGSVKVVDFGLAKVLEHSHASNTGNMSVAYAAPEFFDGRTTNRSDQYSLAVTYCHLRGNRLPFVGNLKQLMNGHLNKPPDLSMLPTSAERDAVAKAMAKEPAERWPSCRAFVKALTIQTPRPHQTPSPIQVPSRDRQGAVPDQRSTQGLAGTPLHVVPAEPPPPVAVAPFDAAAARQHQEGWSEYLASSVEITNSIGMKLVLIPPGRFLMGSPAEEKDRDIDEQQHAVEITRPFYVAVFEVTQEQYEKVMGVNPANFKGPDHPVESVSWEQAAAFCLKLGQRDGRPYRLPTEAEWEYACRAGTSTVFHYGNTLTSQQANFDGNYPYGVAGKGPYVRQTTKVGTYLPNAFGLYDMHGNVWEWCQDAYDKDYYQGSPARDPVNEQKITARVLRGGSWSSNGWLCRAAERTGVTPDYRIYFLGFRVVFPPPGP